MAFVYVYTFDMVGALKPHISSVGGQSLIVQRIVYTSFLFHARVLGCLPSIACNWLGPQLVSLGPHGEKIAGESCASKGSGGKGISLPHAFVGLGPKTILACLSIAIRDQRVTFHWTSRGSLKVESVVIEGHVIRGWGCARADFPGRSTCFA